MNDNVYSKIIKKKKKNARLVNNAKKCKVYKIEFLGWKKVKRLFRELPN